ncbi:MAG: OmpA family protein, partial [bacterium]|nr:OmpA family protein [bacterium]
SSRYVYFPDVNFDFNKSTLSDLGMGRVHQIANLLEKEAGLTVVLEGHSDFKGSEEFNKKLSTNRAEAVKKGLVDLGVDTARLSTVSFGEGTPVFAEQTDWARAVNRRVAVKPATPAME